MISQNSSEKNGLVIADSGAIFSLAVIDQLEILQVLFDEISIPEAVWQEITLDKTTQHYARIYDFFHDKIKCIKGLNTLTPLMDSGESECVLLYKESEADFLLIDDRRARKIAENFGINCIGTLGILSVARYKNFIPALKPLFALLLQNNRFYSIRLLNALLVQHNEDMLA